jgi:hypothetical protein
MQQMIERINARLAALERENRDRPGWLTRLMLAGPRSVAPGGDDAEERHARPATPR